MKVTTWRKLPLLWKEIILLSITAQEEKIDTSKVINSLKEYKEVGKAYHALFQKTLMIEDWPNFTFFNRLSPLEVIYAAYLPIEDIDPIMYFPLTKKLFVENTEIMALDALMLTSSLEELNLENTFVDDITEIMDLSLKVLNVKGCNIDPNQLETIKLRNSSCLIIS